MIYNKCFIEDYYSLSLKSDKTIAYYLWHMTRIEDITSNTLINKTKKFSLTLLFTILINLRLLLLVMN